MMLFLAIALLTGGLMLIWHLDRAARQLEPTLTDLRRTIVITAGAATNLEKTLDLERKAATAQIAIAQQAGAELAAAGSAAQELLAHTDGSLNGENGVLPEATAALEHTEAITQTLEVQARTNLQDLDDTERSLQAPIYFFNQAGAALADKLPAILSGAATTSANVAGTTGELDATAHDLRQVADAFRSDYLKPKNRLWLYIRAMTGLGSDAGNISAFWKTPK